MLSIIGEKKEKKKRIIRLRPRYASGRELNFKTKNKKRVEDNNNGERAINSTSKTWRKNKNKNL